MNPKKMSANNIEMTPEQFREIGYKAIDVIADSLEKLQNRREPARRSVPKNLQDLLLTQELPLQGMEPQALLDFAKENIYPYPLGHINPRFFAWVNSPAAPISIIGELLAAGMNTSAAGGDQASTYLEHCVLDWLKKIMGFAKESGAILVSGGSMATIVGLAVMRHTKSQTGDMRSKGLHQEPKQMVIYKSTEGHSCIDKAIELLGFGHNNLRKIPVDSDFRMNIDKLNEQIQKDRQEGFYPACVVGNAGTVNTGAIDPLNDIADVCEREQLWFHIDGAFGGVGILSNQVKHLFAGIERADSLGIDPHKWMYIPVECGCAIVKNKDAMRDTFSLVPSYIQDDRQLPWFSEFGPQQTRSFRALKLWFAIKHIGIDGYRHLISRDIQLAKSLQEKIRNRSDFQLVSTGPLTVTCFRYLPQNISDIETINRSILAQIQKQGDVYLTSTELNGEFVIRANIINFRTNENDLDFLLDKIAEAGKSLSKN